MILGFFIFEKDEPSTEEDKRVDWIGAALVTAGLVLIVFVLSDAPTARKGWKNSREFSPCRGLRSFQSYRLAQISSPCSSSASYLSSSSSRGSTTWSAGSRTRISRARAGPHRRS